MSVIGGHCLRWRRLLSSISSFRGRSGLSYSSSSAAEATQSPDQTHFMVNYLVNSLGFSSEEAISASTKLTHLKSTQNPDSVINFFKQNGFDNAQIRRIVSSFGASLSTNVQKTLEPKFKFMQSVGISGSDLAKLVTGNPRFFRSRLDTVIIPTINYLKQVLGSEEDVVKVIWKSNWLLSTSVALRRMSPNVLFLKESNFSNDLIKKIIIYQPRILFQKPDKLQEVVRRAEEEFGIPRESPMFPQGMLLASCKKSTLQNKFRVLESFGWKQSDINTLVRKLPCLLSLSEANIRNSLEKRIMPRNDVFRILKDKKLLKGKVELHTLLYKSEEKFLQEFLLPYVVFVPDLYQAYMKRMEQ